MYVCFYQKVTKVKINYICSFEYSNDEKTTLHNIQRVLLSYIATYVHDFNINHMYKLYVPVIQSLKQKSIASFLPML